MKLRHKPSGWIGETTGEESENFAGPTVDVIVVEVPEGLRPNTSVKVGVQLTVLKSVMEEL